MNITISFLFQVNFTLGSEAFIAVCSVTIVSNDVTQRYVLAGYCTESIKNVIQEMKTTIAQGKYMAGMKIMLLRTNINSTWRFDQFPKRYI